MDTIEKKSKPKSKEYPAATLDEAIAFVEKLKDYIPHKPISYEVAANTCGVKITTNSFKYIVSAARQYGLISTSTGKTITFLDPSKRFTRPTETAESLRALKIDCFKMPKLNGDLINQLIGQRIPPIQTLENILVNQYGIVPTVANSAASTFLETAEEIGVIHNGVLDLSVAGSSIETEQTVEEEMTVNTNPSTLPSQLSELPLASKGEFAAPLNISFGDQRRAILYMPIDANQEDAIYVKDMISLMFKRVYGVSDV